MQKNKTYFFLLIYFLKVHIELICVGEMTQWVKTLATQPVDLSSVPRTGSGRAKLIPKVP